MDFTIYDSTTGVIKRIVSCQPGRVDNQIGPGESLYPAKLSDQDMVNPVTGVAIKGAIQAIPQSAPIPLPDYVTQRMAAYPPVNQQLEWIWEAMDANLLPRIEPLYSQVKAVRELYPKTLDDVPQGPVVEL